MRAIRRFIGDFRIGRQANGYRVADALRMACVCYMVRR
jgi:hypothetical protein